MASLALPWRDITHVALTHFHADHTTDLATLLFAWRYGQLPPRSTPATLIGPVGTGALLQRHAQAFGPGLLEANPSLGVVEVESGGQVALDSESRLQALKVPHTDESVAYSVEVNGRRIVVTGDTGFSPELGAWAAGADVLLCECSLPDSLALPTHLTPRECGALAARARPRLLALTHFYPPVEDVDPLAQIRESFDGPAVLCFDGWEHSL
jgi:ribonuclease BN (tRNA processing enzyme)